MLKDAPTFDKVADVIYNLLHGKIWAGHNITSFDNKSIQREFQKLGKSAPQPVGIIDTLPLLRK
jgi:DNA polymerase III epsilon subunit-like protein